MMLSDAKVLTVSELSEYLRVHRSTLYRLLRKGQLPGFKIGSDWRFNVEAIDRWRMQQGTETLDDTPKAESPIIQGSTRRTDSGLRCCGEFSNRPDGDRMGPGLP